MTRWTGIDQQEYQREAVFLGNAVRRLVGQHE
jgi:hypothetical protein